MEEHEKRKLKDALSIFEKIGNKLADLNFEEPLSNMHEEIQNITSKLDNEQDKTFLESIMNSNEFSIDKFQRMIEFQTSNLRFDQKIHDIQNQLFATKRALPKVLENKQKLLESFNKRNTTSGKSLAILDKEIAQLEHNIYSKEQELERIKITYSRKTINDLEYQLEKYSKTNIVILTEDTDLSKIRAILESSKIDLSKIQLITYKGIRNNLFINSLNLIKQLTPWSKIIVHRDRDYLDYNQIEKLKKKANELRYYLWFTSGYDIESHFINEKHIVDLYPELSKEKVSLLVRECINRAKNGTLAKMSKVLGKNYEELFTSNPLYHVIGKFVVRNLHKDLSKELNKKVNLYQPSKYIVSEELEKLVQ